MTDPEYAADIRTGSPPVEKKVTASTTAAGVVSAVLLLVASLMDSDQLVEGLPDWVPLAVGVILTAWTTFMAGYRAPHTARTDLPPIKR